MRDEVTQLIESVCKRRLVTVAEVKSYNNQAPVSMARNECYYRLTKGMGLSTKAAGEVMGRDHASVINGRRRYAEIVLGVKLPDESNRPSIDSETQRERRKAANTRRAKQRYEARRKARKQNDKRLLAGLSKTEQTELRREIFESLLMGSGSMFPALERGYSHSEAVALGRLLCPEIAGKSTGYRHTIARRCLKAEAKGNQAKAADADRDADRHVKTSSGCTRVTGWADGKPVLCGAKTRFRRCDPCEAALSYPDLKPKEALRLVRSIRKGAKAHA